MKLVSRIALGLAFAAGTMSVPALAKGPEFSAPFRAAAGPVQTALKANNYADALAKLAAVDAAAKSPDELFVAAQMRYQVAVAQKDNAATAKALDAMISSGGAPAELRPKLSLAAGQAAYMAGNYPRALQLLNDAKALGDKSVDLLLLLAETNFKSNQLAAGLSYVDQAITTQKASGQPVPKDWYARAASVSLQAKNYTEANKWLRALVGAYPSNTSWRDALTVFRDSQTRDAQANLDIFRLMHDAKALAGERDYFEYAATAADRGMPGEAKSVLDEGAATNAFSTSTRALSDLRSGVSAKVAGDRASLGAAARASASNPKTALATGDAYLGYGDNANAVAMYKLALGKPGVDQSTVNLHMGIALSRLGQKDAARAAFQAVNTQPRQDIAAYWLLFLNQQP